MRLEIATIGITGKCNFSCLHCFNEEVRKKIYRHITLDKYINIVNHLETMGILKFLITGGEPMFHPQFSSLWEYAYKKGIKCEINTNLSLLNDKILASFKKYPPYKISVSLYGFSNNVYSLFTRNSSKFEIVKSNIKKILNNLDSHLNIRYVYTRQTKDDLSPAYEYYKTISRESSFELVSFIEPTIVNSNDGKIDLCRVSVEDNINAIWSIPEVRSEMLKKFYARSKQTKRYVFPCSTIFKGIYVNPDGQISTCEKACNSINIEPSGTNIESEYKTKILPWVNHIEDTFSSGPQCDNCDAHIFCSNCYFTSKCIGNQLIYDSYLCQSAKALFNKCQQATKTAASS